jgi:hypothetical protein
MMPSLWQVQPMPLKRRNVLHGHRLGDQYNHDNEQVYSVIKQLILEGPAYSFITQQIDRVADGRATMQALRAHYEGERFMARQKQEAYTILETVHY